MRESAKLLERNGWPQGQYHVLLAWESFSSFEIVSSIFGGARGTAADWLIVSGQDITCTSAEIWTGGYCRQCPKGTQPNIRGDTCVPCKAGRAGSSGACQLCPAGTVPSLDRSICEHCAVGRTSTAGSNACFACPPGKTGSGPVCHYVTILI